MVIGSKIYPQEYSRSSELIKQNINSRQGILVLDHYIIQSPIADAYAQRAIFFLDKKHWDFPWKMARPDESLLDHILKLDLQFFQLSRRKPIQGLRNKSGPWY